MERKVDRLILGVNPFGYLLHLLSGSPVIGKAKNLSRYHYQTPLNRPLESLEKLPIPLEVEVIQNGVKLHGQVFQEVPDPLVLESLEAKLGIPLVHPLGTTLYTALPIKDRSWYLEREIRSIQIVPGGYRIQTDQDTWFAEELFSTLPATILAQLMGTYLPLRKVFVFRRPVAKGVVGPGWENYSYIYELDREEVSCYLQLRDEAGRNYWVEEQWSLVPQKLEGVKHFYTIPYPKVHLRDFQGVHLFGTYAEWDYRVTLLDVIERYLEEFSHG